MAIPTLLPWDVNALAYYDSTGNTALAGLLNGAASSAQQQMSLTTAGNPRTLAVKFPAAPYGGKFSFMRVADTVLSITLSTSTDSTDGVDGTWTTPTAVPALTSPSRHNVIDLPPNAEPQWLKLEITVPSTVSLSYFGCYVRPDASSPVDYQIVMGASTEVSYRGAILHAIKRAHGRKPLIVNCAVGSSFVEDHVGYLEAALEDFPDAPVVVIAGSLGNNVSSTRPYATANSSALNSARDALRAVIETAQADGRHVVPLNVHFRSYLQAPPTVVPGVNEEDGSKPYNDNIVDPLIEELCPDWWDSTNNRPYCDRYSLVMADTSRIQGDDGVHFQNLNGGNAERDIAQTYLDRLHNHANPVVVPGRMEWEADLAALERAACVAQPPAALASIGEDAAAIRAGIEESLAGASYGLAVYSAQSIQYYPERARHLEARLRGSRTFGISFGHADATPPDDWNQVAPSTSGQALTDLDGNGGVSIRSTASAWALFVQAGDETATASVPQAATPTFTYRTSTPGELILSGLDPDKRYALMFHARRSPRSTAITIGGVTRYMSKLPTAFEDSEVCSFITRPDGSGEIEIAAAGADPSNANSSSSPILGSLLLTEAVIYPLRSLGAAGGELEITLDGSTDDYHSDIEYILVAAGGSAPGSGATPTGSFEADPSAPFEETVAATEGEWDVYVRPVDAETDTTGPWQLAGAGVEVTGEPGPGDTTPPELESATVPSGGDRIIAVTDEDTTGDEGFTPHVNGGPVAVTPDRIDARTVHLILDSGLIYDDDVVTLDYEPGDIEDTSSNAMMSFDDAPVVNNSTQEPPVEPDELTVSVSGGATGPTTAYLTADVSGGVEPVTLAWYHGDPDDGGTVIPGQTAAILALTDLEPEAAYTVYCLAVDDDDTRAKDSVSFTAPAVPVDPPPDDMIPAPAYAIAPKLFQVAAGLDGQFVLTICNSFGEPIPFEGSESLVCQVWQGDDLPAIPGVATPAWKDATAGTATITINGTATIEMGGYRLLRVTVVMGGKAYEVATRWIHIGDSPGSATAPVTYCTLQDMLDAGGDWLATMMQDSGRTDFLPERGRASAELRKIILARRRPPYHRYSLDYGLPLLHVGDDAPDPWLVGLLDAGGLVVTDDIREAVAHLAIAEVCKRSLSWEPDDVFLRRARFFRSEWARLATSLRVGIDTNEDGVADFWLDLGSFSTR